jgi:hypothetical protein
VQAKSRGDFLQYVPSETLAALAYKIAPDVSKIFPRFGG